MSVTATQPAVTTVRHEITVLRQSQQTVPKLTAASLNTVFMEQQGAGRLEELAAALDFPLDFQI